MDKSTHGIAPIRNEKTGCKTMTLANAKQHKPLDRTAITIEVLREKLEELQGDYYPFDSTAEQELEDITHLEKSIELLTKK